MTYNNKEYPGIISFRVTYHNHIYISSIIGGYVEEDDEGHLYGPNEIEQALTHRQNHINELYKKYLQNPKTK